MAFKDKNGFSLINDEHKIRISLSNRARITMAEDMVVFGITKPASFINTVFSNYKDEARASISLYLEQRRGELERLLSETKLDTINKKITIDQILSEEKKDILKNIDEYKSANGKSKLYHINQNNADFLTGDMCNEEQYYSRPGLYIRSVIEEYCSLPFIQRERIYRKDIYQIIETACKEKRILKINAKYYDSNQVFYVYPYKIVPDPLHTQSYLVCYSRKVDEHEDDKIVASFSMARINPPTMLKKTFYLNKEERINIDSQISKYSPAYLVGKPELIKVKLTKKGKLSYQSRLYSRPEKIESLSTDDIYVFDCTQQQIFNYFFSFGPDAEIISPDYLRNRFIRTHSYALNQYNTSTK